MEKINAGPKLHTNTLVFTMDAIGLYTNIKHTEGLKSLEDKLETKKNKKIPTDFIIKLMKVILEHNIFEFNNALWKQIIGEAMGSRHIPHYADILMADIDHIIEDIAHIYDLKDIKAHKLLKRFLYDYIGLFACSTKKLHELLEQINKINPTIQFTIKHTSMNQKRTDVSV